MIAIIRPGQLDEDRRRELTAELCRKLGVTRPEEFDKIYDAMKSAACDAPAAASVEYRTHDPGGARAL